MLSHKFYWGTVRKGIVAFGNLFNNILIDRKDETGTTIQTIKVPLAYAPRDKFIARIQAQPTSYEKSFETYLPRMGFEMTGIQYDPARRLSVVQQNRTINNSSTSMNAQYSPTPYNVGITLYVYSKNQDDGLQIIEQILPYFNPDFNLSLKALPDLNIVNDLLIELDNISYDDEYEGDFSQRRAIIWTLNFTMKLNFFGPINRQSIIKSVNTEIFNTADMSNTTVSYNVTVDPFTAVPGDTVTFIEQFEEF